MRGLLVLLAGMLLVATGGPSEVTAQDRRLPPDPVSEQLWESFAEAVESDPDTKRRAHFKRGDIEPVLETWEKELDAVFVPQWEYALRGREIVGSTHRWTLESASFNTSVGSFDLFVLHQSGGGQFRQSWTVPQGKVDALDFEFAASVRQGTPFDARIEKLDSSASGANADTAIARLCELAGSDYSIPKGSAVRAENAEVRFQFRDRTIRDCIWKIAQSVGWKASITDSHSKLQEAVTFEHLEKWFETKGGDEEAGTWRNAMKSLLGLKLVKIESEDLFVHVRAG